jgi:hypothetical protein
MALKKLLCLSGYKFQLLYVFRTGDNRKRDDFAAGNLHAFDKVQHSYCRYRSVMRSRFIRPCPQTRLDKGS